MGNIEETLIKITTPRPPMTLGEKHYYAVMGDKKFQFLKESPDYRRAWEDSARVMERFLSQARLRTEMINAIKKVKTCVDDLLSGENDECLFEANKLLKEIINKVETNEETFTKELDKDIKPV